jgi:hypothetical protein
MVSKLNYVKIAKPTILLLPILKIAKGSHARQAPGTEDTRDNGPGHAVGGCMAQFIESLGLRGRKEVRSFGQLLFTGGKAKDSVAVE